MENMEEDLTFFKYLAKIQDENAGIGKSNTGPKAFNEEEFWGKVDMNYIKDLTHPFIYGYDLQMFGYSLKQYFDGIGLKLI